MKSVHTLVLVGLVLFVVSLKAQDRVEREIDIHNNVRLIQMAIPQDMPEELKVKTPPAERVASGSPPEEGIGVRKAPLGHLIFLSEL